MLMNCRAKMTMFSRVFYRRTRLILILFGIAVVIQLFLFARRHSKPKEVKMDGILVPMKSGFGKIPKQQVVEQVCVQAKLELYPNQKFRDFFKDEEKPVCPGKDWVTIENGVFKMLKSAKEEHGPFTCDYQPIIRGEDDFHYSYGNWVKGIQDGYMVPNEVGIVSCSAGFFTKYNNIHITVPYVEENQKLSQKFPLPKESMGLNVLIFGFDSVSRMTWLRKLPKTYEYMKNVLGSIVLEGYNIVGDGTPAALLPILTGQTEFELPEVRKGHKGADNLDGHPFIWKEFAKAGYVTQYIEDSSTYGTFQFRFKGFKKKPTTHFLREFFVELEKRKNPRLCIGSQYKHSVVMNYLKDFETRYQNGRRFNFGFYDSISHDSNGPLNFADAELKQWLQKLNEGGFLNNTLLILMSDHGARYQYLREHLQGKMEERNPFFSLRLPPWFKEKYPVAYKNLLTNTKRLTTPFDIYATLQDILKYRSQPKGDVSQRSISLFSEMPITRSCGHASIDPHWCNCLDWKPVKNDSVLIKRASQVVIDFVNNLTSVVREQCQPLSLKAVLEPNIFTPNKLYLSWKRSKDYDQRPDWSDDTKVDKSVYQMKIYTTPGNGHFEVTINYDHSRDKFTLSEPDISRTNKYGSDPECIAKILPGVSKYCYCKNRPR